MKTWFEIALWKRILGAMVVGALVGALWGPGATSIGWIGDLFIRLIFMIVVPLVFVTIVSGVVSMGDPSKLGSLGIKTLALYMFTTLGAICIGLFLATVLQPGVGVDLSDAPAQTLGETIPITERLMSIVPSNPIGALAEGDILATIFFALLLGVGILTVGAPARSVADFMDASSEVVLKITHWIMEVAPFGVFALIARVTGEQGFEVLLNAVTLAVTVLLACVLHLIIMHGALIMRLILRLSPVMFFRGARDAMLVAFSTSSSAATLPVSMSVAEDNLGIKPVVASTVLPLGATINMDGTALYVGAVTVFAAQAFGIELTMTDYLLMAGTTTLVSIGTAAVPSASLFLMSAVMDTIGMTPDQIAVTVGFIFIIDRPLDMLRTAINICGDLSVSTAVANWEGEFDRAVFEQPLNS
ncbi:MAG: dicarboxylate/amino acid:cation symporter [Gammaproteobacteria bacterium]|nr:dicarboxylate/amino acid:cation symporter [Gammaproteobacteria bacterium]MCY4357078.1 dicarboxylate/amino acid:cation symporter [Gammaproteobacteria bacterium]